MSKYTIQIGIFFTMSSSGVVCTYFGWRAIFYVHGLASAICLVRGLKEPYRNRGSNGIAAKTRWGRAKEEV